VGAKGNDQLVGGTGNDKYVFSLGDGQDVIVDNLNPHESSVLSFDAGITRQNLHARRDGQDCVISYGTQGDCIRLINVANDNEHAFLIELSDKSRHTLDDLLNHAPVVLNPIEDQTAGDRKSFSFTLPSNTFGDEDGDSLTYVAKLANGDDLPEWLTFDPATQTFSGTPTPEMAGNFIEIQVIAKDQYGESVADVFSLAVGKTLIGDWRDDQLIGSAGDDVAYGNGGNDYINLFNGNNLAYGAYGNDTILAGSGDDIVYGNGGNDWIDVGAGANQVFAGWGDDVISALNGNNLIQAGGGNNTVTTGSGNDQITADWGNDIINAGDGNNTVTAGVGNNRVTTGSGNDTISTGSGNDVIEAGNGNNAISAGEGVNLITAGSGHDQITTLSGDDTINAGDGNNTISAGEGRNTITTGSGDDIIQAFGVNTIASGAGNDQITTSWGSDTIDGGAGDDIIRAGGGNNVLRGGEGNDQFISAEWSDDLYQYAKGDGQDIIQDAGGRDTLKLEGINSDQLWFSHVGNDLQISVLGTEGFITVKDWYAGNQNHLDVIQTADGKTLLDSQVDALVSAMASFTPPSAGETALSQSLQDQLQPVLAANWH